MEQIHSLEDEFSKDEVYDAICAMVGDKTPEPGGFLLCVYLVSWPFMKKEIMSIFQELHRFGYLDWRLNATFVTLILNRK